MKLKYKLYIKFTLKKKLYKYRKLITEILREKLIYHQQLELVRVE